MNRKTSVVSKKADARESKMAKSQADISKKILPEKEVSAKAFPLSGWALIDEAISIEEVERERLMREIPYFREQAIHTIAYWISLSRRIEAMSRTRQLLALMPHSALSSAEPLNAQSGLPKND
jgi:hypothetical protein